MMLQEKAINFKRRLESGYITVRNYEDENIQRQVLDEIDFTSIYQYYIDEKDNQQEERKDSRLYSTEELVIIATMRWFKCDFFKWCNKPACENINCDGKPSDMENQGMDSPNTFESQVGQASRVEIYRCKKCFSFTRFPRYNNPAFMMKHSRRGRCGEFANTFGAVCRCLGFDVNYVLDFTDHVWIEVWIDSLQRFVHVDPCERSIDSPLMYEIGWQKKLTHVLSFSRYGVFDAITRYSKKIDEVKLRRNEDIIESSAEELINSFDQKVESMYASGNTSEPGPLCQTRAFAEGLEHFLSQGKQAFGSPPKLSNSEMRERKFLHRRELESLQHNHEGGIKPAEQQGRSSGDLQWRLQRGEIHVQSQSGSCAAETVELHPSRAEHEGRESLWQNFKSSEAWRWLFMPGLPLLSNHYKGRRSLEIKVLLNKDCPNRRVFSSSIFRGAGMCYINKVPVPVRKSGITLLYLQDSCYLTRCDADQACNVEEIVFGNSKDEDECIQSFQRRIKSTEGVFLLSYNSDNSHCTVSHNEMLQQGLRALGAAAEQISSLENDSTLWAICKLRKGVVTSDRLQIFSESANSIASEGACSIVRPTCICLWIDDSVDESQRLQIYSHDFIPYDNLCCGFISQILIPESADSYDFVLAKAKKICEENFTFVGFSLSKDLSCNASGVRSVFIFSSQGYPLRPVPSTVTYLKHAVDLGEDHGGHHISHPLASSLQLRWFGYYGIGGGTHSDTLVFDGAETITHRDRLRSLSLWSGSDLANGVQCDYIGYSGPTFSSSAGNPAVRSKNITEYDRVESVLVRAGALIDRVEIKFSSGDVLYGGGSGGSLSVIPIPTEAQLMGFFGGTGGHLHNLGLVLLFSQSMSEVAGADQITSDLPAEFSYLHELALLNNLYSELGLMNFASMQRQPLEENIWQHNNIRSLFELIANVLERNSVEAARTGIAAVAAYMLNIHKNFTEDKFQRIKIGNNYFTQKVLLIDGVLPLLCFGPAAFRLVSDTLHFESRIKYILSKLPDQVTRKDVLTWLRKYAQFLSDVATNLS